MNTKISIGSVLPRFKLKDQYGNDFDIGDNIGNYSLVIYFYPKDDTPGCTAEACSFRDHYEDFSEMGAQVIGISSDTVESHRKFAEKHNLSFTLLSDIDGVVRKLFGVPNDLFGFIPGRVTYIVDKSGKVIHLFNSQFNARKHVTEALKILQKLG